MEQKVGKQAQSARLGNQGVRAAARGCSMAEAGKQTAPSHHLCKRLLEIKEAYDFEHTIPEENKPKDFSFPWHINEQKAEW